MAITSALEYVSKLNCDMLRTFAEINYGWGRQNEVREREIYTWNKPAEMP